MLEAAGGLAEVELRPSRRERPTGTGAGAASGRKNGPSAFRLNVPRLTLEGSRPAAGSLGDSAIGPADRSGQTVSVANWDDVRRLVAALPGTDEQASYGRHPSWRVHQKMFVWDRPLTRADQAALGDQTPPESEPLLGVRVADEGVKAALIADEPDIFFTTPHFNGYPAVLVRLERIPLPELAELIEDAWRLRAPKLLLAEFDRQKSL